MDDKYVLFCLAPGSCWKRPLYGEVIFVILSPVFPVVVGPEGVVVVIRPTVSHATGLEIVCWFLQKEKDGEPSNAGTLKHWEVHALD